MSQRLTSEDEGVDSDYLLKVLGDERSRAILDATSCGAKSVGRLSQECGIPESTVYRRAREMTEEGLLSKEVSYRDDGQHVKEYRMSEELSNQEIGVSSSLKLEVRYDEQGEEMEL